MGTFILASYWSAEFGTFSSGPALASHWLEDFADQMGLVGGSSGMKKTSCGSYSSLDLPPYISTKDKCVSRGNPFNPIHTYDISCFKNNLPKVLLTTVKTETYSYVTDRHMC
jgi:hypothetical protein